jgi:hypothetical protein
MIVLARMTGRCANGFERDGGRLVHAICEDTSSHGVALCGARPGRLSAGWGPVSTEVDQITCKRCARKKASGIEPALTSEEGD